MTGSFNPLIRFSRVLLFTLAMNAGACSDSIKNENVYITKTGKRYHRAECSSLGRSKIIISLEEAIKKKYTPCLKCHPPQSLLKDN